MTREYWEVVAENVNSFANSGDDEHCLRVLSLSYNHLPIHLKPCFLYMSVFHEDDEIEVSELIKLWVAEVFLKPIKDKTLEETAQKYLDDLIGRNLFLIREQWWFGAKRKMCGIHDLLRDLCIRESRKEHFYCVRKVQKLISYPAQCFLCSRREVCTRICLPVTVSSKPTALAGCLVCDFCKITYPWLDRLRLVKIFENLDKCVEDIIMHPTKLRHLTSPQDIMFVGNSIHLLWNLQTLCIDSFTPIGLPSEIWELAQLRHLIVDKTVLPDPPLITQDDRKDSPIILKNLQTLSGIKNFRWSEDAIERLPNLKTLSIQYFDGVQEWSYYSLHNLGHLHKLESLNLYAEALFTLENIAFPNLLKELYLSGCRIPWEEMTIIGTLPNLELLQVYNHAFKGPEWSPIEGEFLQLKLLMIWEHDLACWGAEKIHFPNLEHIQLGNLEWLEEIPSGIGEIETLRSIRLYSCSDPIVNSAKQILEEQHSFGNEDLQLYVDEKLVLPDSG